MLGLAWLYSRTTQLAALPATLLASSRLHVAPAQAPQYGGGPYGKGDGARGFEDVRVWFEGGRVLACDVVCVRVNAGEASCRNIPVQRDAPRHESSLSPDRLRVFIEVADKMNALGQDNM